MRKDLINEAIIELTRFYSLSSKQADVFLDRLKSTENSSINELIELQYMINMYYGYWYAISVRDWKIAESYSCCLEGYLEGNRNKNVIIEAFYPKYLRDFLLECTNEEENILDFNVEGNGLVQDSKSLIDANEIKRIKSKIFNKSLFNQFIIIIKN